MLQELLHLEDLPDEVVIVKLDIEGAEISAIEGAAKLRELPHLVILYEDHGNDEKHKTSKYLISLGFAITFLGDEVQPPKEIADTSQIDSLKRNRAKGYNFVARRS